MDQGSNLNLRVFRRNNKGLILLWNGSHVEQRYKNVHAYLVGSDGVERPLSRFVPDNPEKFNGDVEGLVIAHLQNSMDPVKSYDIRLIFGGKDDSFVMDKQVLSATPIAKDPASSETVVHMYGYDYDNEKWVPLPVNTSLFLKQGK
jgi:hypothetical protein